MRGFTLLELLIVVALIAVAAGVVSLAVGGEENRQVREETERLAALFRIAASEARTSGRALAWEADLEGYSFRTLGGDEGLREELQRRRSWPFAVEHVTPRVVFTREPVREPALIEIATPERELRLALDALGKLTAVDCAETRCAASR